MTSSTVAILASDPIAKAARVGQTPRLTRPASGKPPGSTLCRERILSPRKMAIGRDAGFPLDVGRHYLINWTADLEAVQLTRTSLGQIISLENTFPGKCIYGIRKGRDIEPTGFLDFPIGRSVTSLAEG